MPARETSALPVPESDGDSCSDWGGGNMNSSFFSGKLRHKLRSESGKFFPFECHFPPKSGNFGTLGSAGEREKAGSKSRDA